jgi:hypothetical protein
VNKLKVIVAPRPGYQSGMYGLTIGHDSGGTANVEAIKDEAELRARLLKFGLSNEYADDVIERLKTRHDSVTFEIAADREEGQR